MSRMMNAKSLVLSIGIAGVMTGTAPAHAQGLWRCDGYNNNNRTSIGSAGCSSNWTQISCWEDPAHTPPQWEDGFTYAFARAAVCSGVEYVAAYALGPLHSKMLEIGGSEIMALAEGVNSNGTSVFGYAVDDDANGNWGNWELANGAVSIRATAYVF